MESKLTALSYSEIDEMISSAMSSTQLCQYTCQVPNSIQSNRAIGPVFVGQN